MRLYFILSVFLVALASDLIAQEYDIIIRNGTIIDAKSGLNGPGEIAILDGKIAALGTSVDGMASTEIDASGLYVVPGLIDLHGHHFYGTSEDSYLSDGFLAVPPDGFTLRVGVTTVCDAGGAGWRNFEQFKEQVIDRSKTRVLSFLNIVGHGMKGGAVEQNLDDMDGDATADKVNQYREDIIGIKVAHYSGPEWTPVREAVKAGMKTNVPVMIDFGGTDPPLSLRQLLLEELRPGDIYTHMYANVRGRETIVDEEKKTVRDYITEAVNRGIVFDVGHGGGSFRFSQALPAIEEGLWPTTISTDLHTGSMNGAMKDMLNVASKFLNMGMDLTDAIEKMTSVPARVINRSDLGHLSVGGIADIAILRLHNGSYGFVDVVGEKIEGSMKLECELTIKDGNILYDLNGLSK